MRHDPANFPSLKDGYTVQLMEQCDGWSISVTRAGRTAAFEVYHRDPQRALAMAKAVAVTEGANLVVVSATRGGHEFVPATHVASYTLPIRRELTDARQCG